MIKGIILNTKYKKEIILNINNRKEKERMYFIKLNKVNNRKFDEGRIRREKIRKILKQPKGEKYYMLYSGLCSYAFKHENRINYRTKEFINDFYNENKKALKNMRICEIIEGFKMLNLINLISIKEEYIRVNYYKYVRHMESIKQFRRQYASR